VAHAAWFRNNEDAAMSTAPDTAVTPSTNADDDLLTMLRGSAQDFCARALDRARLRALRGATPPFDRACWNEMAELGWLGAMLPENRNGLGVGTRGAATLARALGSVAAPEPLIETAVAAAILLDHCGSEQHRLEALTNGESIIVAVLGASDDDPFTVIDASGDADSIVLSGTLDAVPLGADADTWLIPANHAGVPAWFLVEAGSDGVSVSPRPLADGSRDARLVLKQSPATLLTRGDEARGSLLAARAVIRRSRPWMLMSYAGEIARVLSEPA